MGEATSGSNRKPFFTLSSSASLLAQHRECANLETEASCDRMYGDFEEELRKGARCFTMRGTPCHHPTKNISEILSKLSRFPSHLLNCLVCVVARVQVREDEHVRPPRHLAGAALQLGARGFRVYRRVVLEGALNGQVRPLLLRELGCVNNLLDGRAYRRNEGYLIVGLLLTVLHERVPAQPSLRFGKLFLELLLGELGRMNYLLDSRACRRDEGYALGNVCS
jgi:hypothetical protein